jgi:hypothetical protein
VTENAEQANNPGANQEFQAYTAPRIREDNPPTANVQYAQWVIGEKNKHEAEWNKRWHNAKQDAISSFILGISAAALAIWINLLRLDSVFGRRLPADIQYYLWFFMACSFFD